MTLIIIIGIAVTTWEEFNVAELATTTNFNINQPLGLFFTALLFLCLAFYLPKMVRQAVGEISSSVLESNAPIVATMRESVTTAMATTGGGGMSNMQAATTLTASSGGSPAYESSSSTASAATIPTATTGISSGGGIDSQTTKDALSQASKVSKSISENTVKRIKQAVSQAMKEKKS